MTRKPGVSLGGPAAVRMGIRGLHPAYFGLVMATGIVPITAGLQGMPARC